MEFMIDPSGAPAVKLNEGKYISVLPVTKYQFERYIWNSAADYHDYDKLVQKTGRVPPVNITKRNFNSVFLTGISYTVATGYSSYFDVRLPTANEWESAYVQFFADDTFLAQSFEYIRSQPLKLVDIRILTVLERFVTLKIKRASLHDIMEIATEHAQKNQGRLFLKYQENETAWITGNPTSEVSNTSFAFSIVLLKQPEYGNI